ncbi:MAG: ABC transporter permease [Clostridia bacterium]|nr:ABC transporter permease [Clostridia bacterium]
MDILTYFKALPPAVAQGMIWGIMAIGVYITYKILDIADLTVDGSICTGAAVCAVLMSKGCNVWIALLGAFIAGMLAGLVTGLFHTFMGIPPILSGILTQLILWSVNLKLMGLGFEPARASASNLALPARKYDLLVSQLDINHTIIVLELFCIVLIAGLYCFFGTEYGCSLRATGANLAMSRAQGINTDNRKIFGLVLSNGLVALSGGLLAQYQGNADANMGKGAIVIGLAAICIGDALFSWLCRNNFALKLIAVVLGAIVYYIVYATVIYLGLDSNYLKMLSALLVAFFLAVPYWKKKYFSGRKRFHLRHQKIKEKKETKGGK